MIEIILIENQASIKIFRIEIIQILQTIKIDFTFFDYDQ